MKACLKANPVATKAEVDNLCEKPGDKENHKGEMMSDLWPLQMIKFIIGIFWSTFIKRWSLFSFLAECVKPHHTAPLRWPEAADCSGLLPTFNPQRAGSTCRATELEREGNQIYHFSWLFDNHAAETGQSLCKKASRMQIQEVYLFLSCCLEDQGQWRSVWKSKGVRLYFFLSSPHKIFTLVDFFLIF